VCGTDWAWHWRVRQAINKSRRVELYEQELAHYRADAESAKKMATEPIGALTEGADAAEAAAWTVVANVLLNLDGFLTKG